MFCFVFLSTGVSFLHLDNEYRQVKSHFSSTEVFVNQKKQSWCPEMECAKRVYTGPGTCSSRGQCRISAHHREGWSDRHRLTTGPTRARARTHAVPAEQGAAPSPPPRGLPQALLLSPPAQRDPLAGAAPPGHGGRIPSASSPRARAGARAPPRHPRGRAAGGTYPAPLPPAAVSGGPTSPDCRRRRLARHSSDTAASGRGGQGAPSLPRSGNGPPPSRDTRALRIGSGRGRARR